MTARPAAADVPLVKVAGWDVSLYGRLNTFLSYAYGDAQPTPIATWTGVEDRSAGGDTIESTRVRSGLVTNVLGYTLVKDLTPNLRVTGRFGEWVGVSQNRSHADNPSVDVREVYVKIEGRWGGLLAGRNLGLFERGAIMMDYDIEHGYGLGHPCAVRIAVGGACGHAGHGLLFPHYTAGFVYNTPEAGGLQLTAGLFDPAAVSERNYERTPYPRVEAELTWHIREVFGVFFDALWQRIGNADVIMGPNMMAAKDDAGNVVQQNADATGLAAGARFSLGPLTAGVAAYQGKGLGLYVPMENSPLFADEKKVLRRSQGAVGLASVTFGQSKVAGGVGVSQLKMSDVTLPNGMPLEQEPFPMLTFPRQQLGYSAGFYHGFAKTIYMALEFFRGEYDWYDSCEAGADCMKDPSAIQKNHQAVNFFNAGVTLVF